MNQEEQNIEFEELDLLRIIDLTLKFQSSIRNCQQQKIALETLMLKLAYLDKTVDKFAADAKKRIAKMSPEKQKRLAKHTRDWK